MGCFLIICICVCAARRYREVGEACRGSATTSGGTVLVARRQRMQEAKNGRVMFGQACHGLARDVPMLVSALVLVSHMSCRGL